MIQRERPDTHTLDIRMDKRLVVEVLQATRDVMQLCRAGQRKKSLLSKIYTSFSLFVAAFLLTN